MSQRYGRNQRRRHLATIRDLHDQLARMRYSRDQTQRALNESRRETEEARNAPLNLLSTEAIKHLGTRVAEGIAQIHDKRMQQLISEISQHDIACIRLATGPDDPDRKLTVLRIQAKQVEYGFMINVEDEMRRCPAAPPAYAAHEARAG